MNRRLFESRILIMDGPMGTILHPPSSLAIGVAPCDLMNLHDPERVARLHSVYLDAGADILRSNTFNSNAVSLRDEPQSSLHELNATGVRIARSVAARAGRLCLVAGALGPTSLRPDQLPASSLVSAFYAQSAALVDAGADLLIAETIAHPQTMAAFLEAVGQLSKDRSDFVPVIVSVAPVDAQSLGAFLDPLKDYELLALGLNCVAAGNMEFALEYLATKTTLPLCVYPSAGLPDPSGQYPDSMPPIASAIERFARRGMVNIAGGCCGTTAALTQTLSDVLKDVPPRRFAAR